jgi:hypothetical protein
MAAGDVDVAGSPRVNALKSLVRIFEISEITPSRTITNYQYPADPVAQRMAVLEN